MTVPTFSNLGVSAAPDFSSGVDTASYATASWTPPTSGLIPVVVWSREGTGPNQPTLSGNGLTWVAIASVVVSTIHRLTLFAANAAGSSTGATTIDFAGQTQLACTASFSLATDVDLTGGVAAAFVQAQTNTATSTSLSITLSSASHADNRPFAAFFHATNEVVTPRTNWTELDDLGSSAPINRLETQYRADAFETTASASWATSSSAAGIAAELKAAGGGDTALVVSDAAHAHAADNTALTQAYVLTVQDAGHASGAENVALLQAHLLAVGDAAHGHTADTPALVQAFVLAVANSTHDHTAESPALTQAFFLAVADATHAHTSENVELFGAVVLVVADVLHAHSADHVVLVGQVLLGHLVLSAQAQGGLALGHVAAGALALSEEPEP